MKYKSDLLFVTLKHNQRHRQCYDVKNSNCYHGFLGECQAKDRLRKSGKGRGFLFRQSDVRLGFFILTFLDEGKVCHQVAPNKEGKYTKRSLARCPGRRSYCSRVSARMTRPSPAPCSMTTPSSCPPLEGSLHRHHLLSRHLCHRHPCVHLAAEHQAPAEAQCGREA